MELKAKRVTPLTVLPDIAESVRRYEALGLERVPGEEEGLVGFLAGKTGVMVATTEFMAGDFDPAHVERLVGQPIHYIHVASVDEARKAVPNAHLLQDVIARGETRELLLEDTTGFFILAETIGR